MKRKFAVKIIVEADTETLKEGMDEAKKTISSLGLKVHEAKPIQSTRTLKQNAALHLYFTQLAEELNASGQDMRSVIRQDIDIPWTSYTVKEYLWRPVQKAYLGKKSTTKLDTLDIDRIYDIVNKAIGERTGVHVHFPSLEFLMQQDERP